MRRDLRVPLLLLIPLFAGTVPVRAADGVAAPTAAAPAGSTAAPAGGSVAPAGSTAAAGAVSPAGAAAAPAAAARPPARSADLAERDAAYRAFRSDFEAGRYTEALPHAERVVALTEEADPESPQLPSALNNLGATQYELGDFIAAEKAYARALQIVEEHAGSTSPRLIGPLRGLAMTYQAGGRKDAAAPLLERAVAISRRSDGLFNPGQLALIEPLIDSYVASGRLQDADQMHQYAFRLDERRYGASGAKLVPSLQKLAGWFEQTQRYTQARRAWARSFSVSMQRGQENLGGAVNALRGMARTYRLEYQYGPEQLEEQAAAPAGQVGMQFDASERDAFGRRLSSNGNDYRLDPQGREFLEAALKMVEHTVPPSTQAQAVLLIEIGDWSTLTERDGKALPYYERAWALLPHVDPGSAEAPRNPLLYPTPLLYRPPVGARRLRDAPTDSVTERVAIAEFTVGTDGKVRDAKIVEGDATEGQRMTFLAAISRAIYRPKFVDGKPVVTENVRFRETFREQKRAVEPTAQAAAPSGN